MYHVIRPWQTSWTAHTFLTFPDRKGKFVNLSTAALALLENLECSKPVVMEGLILDPIYWASWWFQTCFIVHSYMGCHPSHWYVSRWIKPPTIEDHPLYYRDYDPTSWAATKLGEPNRVARKSMKIWWRIIVFSFKLPRIVFFFMSSRFSDATNCWIILYCSLY